MLTSQCCYVLPAPCHTSVSHVNKGCHASRCRAHAELLRQHWLLLSLHWAACGDGAGCSMNVTAAGQHGAELWPFGHGSCAYGRGLWRHIRGCSGARCGNAM